MQTSIAGASEVSRFLWAKKPRHNAELCYLPLSAHLADAAEIARLLWENWVADSIKRIIPLNVFILCVALHDLGKATPVFQIKGSLFPGGSTELDEFLRESLRDAGFVFANQYANTQDVRHELASHEILRRHRLHDSVCIVLSGHHGKPPNEKKINDLCGIAYASHLGFKRKECPKWLEAQDALFNAALERAGMSIAEARSLRLTRPQQALLSGLVILADWIASDESLFPLVDIYSNVRINSVDRALRAMRKLDLPERWVANPNSYNLFEKRFRFGGTKTPRPVQEAALTVAQMKPGIMIIEAPMGEGKTEAALAAAEMLAAAGGQRGVYFALPTQATSDAIFERINKWLERFDTKGEGYNVRLAHGKAELNETYRNIKLSQNIPTDGDEKNYAFVHEWLDGRKKGMLADFAVGTIDHVLMAALKQKHLVLRHLGLAGKVVVLDEVHACDVYMESYLLMALKWLGAYGVPVVVLSATLPAERRHNLLEAYIGEPCAPIRSSAYPIISYALGKETGFEEPHFDERRSLDVSLRRVDSAALADELEAALAEGGYAGVIVNTVDRAQKFYRELQARFGDCVYLLHARLLACERAKLEKELSQKLGPPTDENPRPGKLILVGTQVLEQSLDFDFDILASDLCPMDLLLQRIGRLHRHARSRPKNLRGAQCLVMEAEGELEHDAEAIYMAYPLKRTRDLLPEKVRLPADIPRLVEALYDKNYDDSKNEECADDRSKWNNKQIKSKRKAQDYQISQPDCGVDKPTLFNWLDMCKPDDSENRSEAAVRDGADSVEAIVIQKRGDSLHILPWIENAQAIPLETPSRELAIKLAGCSVRLPTLFSGEWIIDETIEELEGIMSNLRLKDLWYASSLLKGTLCLVLDENMSASLCGRPIKYEEKLGLIHKKEA